MCFLGSAKVTSNENKHSQAVRLGADLLGLLFQLLSPLDKALVMYRMNPIVT